MCFAFLLLFGDYAYAVNETPAARNGMLDLRNQTISENINLNGEWLFYWNELLDDPSAQHHPGLKVQVPGLWNNYDIDGKTYPAFGYATYKLTVLLPKNSGLIRISMPDVYTAYRLLINGELVASNGKVGKSKADYAPEWVMKEIDLQAVVDTLNMLLQISNFAHSKGGIRKPILLGPKEFAKLDRRRSEAIDLISMGCVLMGGFYFLGLYLFGNRDKAILLFALFAMIYSPDDWQH